ncbi:hypothetical protein predicted by Glimmer/Critica [Salmonella enterica subsp. enterica serovar Weltevreden str. 2007-60-3289-1]|nr:hypothetical protein predicted by Glimmer/Critica [Salmonella enterica subsp. enterica serovar Weltevreden str. 2007-60-3289-1]
MVAGTTGVCGYSDVAMKASQKKCLCFSLFYVPDAVEQVKHVLQHCFIKYLYAQHRWNIAGNKVEQRIGWRSTCSTSLFQKVEQAQPL